MGSRWRGRVLVLLAILAGLGGVYAYTHLPRGGGRAGLLDGVVGCQVVKLSVEVALATTPRPSLCPSVAELVAAHHLSADRGDDPWGTPYVMRCDDGEGPVTT